MGHYVLLHIPKEMAIISAILLFLLYLGYRLSNGMLARWGAQWGIRGLAGLGLAPGPALRDHPARISCHAGFHGVSRHFEHEADRYGLEVIHGIVDNPNQVAAHYFQKSGEKNLSDPDPANSSKSGSSTTPPAPSASTS